MQNFLKYVEVVRKNTTRALSLGLLFTHIAEEQGMEVRFPVLRTTVLHVRDEPVAEVK